MVDAEGFSKQHSSFCTVYFGIGDRITSYNVCYTKLLRIQTLVNRMDDVMDLIEKANARMAIYDLPAPPENIDKMLAILRNNFV